MKTPHLVILAMINLVAAGSAWAEEKPMPARSEPAKIENTEHGFRWLRFEVGAVALLQPDLTPKGSSYSPALYYAPSYRISDKLLTTWSTGAALIKGIADTKFVAAESRLRVAYLFTDLLGVEAGGGIQFWTDDLVIHPVAGAGVRFDLGELRLGPIEAATITGSKVFVPNNATWQIGGAVTLRFGGGP